MARKIQVPECVVSAGPEAVNIYRSSIRKGNSPRFAEMAAMRKPNGFNGGEDVFFNRYGTLHKQLGDQAEMVIAAARRKGYNPGPNDVYMPSMCRPIGAAGGKGGVGDPIAFFSPGSGARKQMKERIEKHWGTETDGWVKTKQNFHNRAGSVLPTPGLAPDLVQDIYASKAIENPDLIRSEAETKYAIAQEHGAASKDRDLKELEKDAKTGRSPRKKK